MISLTVLGACAACPGPGGASSSYLVQQATTSLLIDCGPGSLPNLRRAIDYRSVTAIVLSHLHSDHILDLIPYRYGLRYGPGASGARLPLWVPPGGAASLEVIGQAIAGESGFFEATFEVGEYQPAAGLTIGGLSLSFVAMQHYIPSWGIRIETGGAVLAYSADTGPTPALTTLARAADLFLCEATLPEDWPAEPVPGHLRASEAGAAASVAGVGRLLLTHIWPELGREHLLAGARTTYAGPIDVAREGERYAVPAEPLT